MTRDARWQGFTTDELRALIEALEPTEDTDLNVRLHDEITAEYVRRTMDGGTQGPTYRDLIDLAGDLAAGNTEYDVLSGVAENLLAGRGT